MAKKILIKARKVLIVTLAIFFVILLGIKVLAGVVGYAFDISSLLYWLLFLLIVGGSTYDFSKRIIFPVGLTFYVLGSLLFVITLKEASELMLRVGILFFLVGIGRALLEYKDAGK